MGIPRMSGASVCDTKLDRDVALKTFANPDRLARFEHEAKVLTLVEPSAHHSHLLLEDRALVMEPGGTLAKRRY